MSDFKCIGAKEIFGNGQPYARNLVIQHQDGRITAPTFEKNTKYMLYDGVLLDYYGRPVVLGDGITMVVRPLLLSEEHYDTALFLVERNDGKLAMAEITALIPTDDFLESYPTLPDQHDIRYIPKLEIKGGGFRHIDREITETQIAKTLAEKVFRGKPVYFVKNYCDSNCQNSYGIYSTTDRHYVIHDILPRETLLKAKGHFSTLPHAETFSPKTITASEDGACLVATYVDKNGIEQKAYMDAETVLSKAHAIRGLCLCWYKK